MAINLKAKETLIQVGEMKGQYRFILGTELYNKLSESKVIKEAAIRSVAGGFIDGFTTALLKMHPGDHWQVFIPYQLAYGESGNSSIQGYSMLRF